MLTVGKIVGGAFGLIKNHPAAVLVWGLIYMAGVAALGLAMGSAFASVFAAQKDPAAGMQQVQSMAGTIMLMEFGMMILMVVLFTATQRAVLRPEQGGLAFLRLGMDEVKMFALAFVMLIAFIIGYLVVGLITVLIAAVLAVALGPGAAIVPAMLAFFAILAFIFWFAVRVSLMFPLTLMTGNIAIGEGWRLSKGRFWTLFGGYFLIALILIALWTVVLMLTMGPYFAALTRAGSDPVAMQQAMQTQMAQYASLTPQGILSLVLFGILGGLGLALQGGAVATAARELTVDRDGMAQTFA